MEILCDKVLISSFFKFQISTYIQKQPPEVFCKNRCSEKFRNSQENTCARPEACNFIKKETLAQVFSCEFC